LHSRTQFAQFYGIHRLEPAIEHADFPGGNILRMATAPKPDRQSELIDIDLAKHAYAKNSSLLDDAENAPIRFWNGTIRILVDQGKYSVTYRARQEPGKEIWSAEFKSPAFPATTFSPGYIGLLWPAQSPDAEEMIGKSEELKRQKPNIKWGAWLVQIRDSMSGKIEAQRLVSVEQREFVLVQNRLLQKSELAVAGDWLVIPEPGNRLLIENWKTGALVARGFGRPIAFNEITTNLVLQNGERELKLITLNSGTERDPFIFPDRVVTAAFDEKGKRTAVVTADQKLYTLQVQ
jgi:hypothetical protein